MQSDTQAVSTETLLRVVADPMRRSALRRLRATDDREVSVEELTTTLESHGHEADSESGRTAIELRHTHLPLLADANVITYDRGRESVVYRGDDRLEALLEFVADRLE